MKQKRHPEFKIKVQCFALEVCICLQVATYAMPATDSILSNMHSAATGKLEELEVKSKINNILT